MTDESTLCATMQKSKAAIMGSRNSCKSHLHCKPPLSLFFLAALLQKWKVISTHIFFPPHVINVREGSYYNVVQHAITIFIYYH